MGCSFRPDGVAGFLRMRWQLCTGLGGRNHRNTQLALIWLFIMLHLSWPRRSETPPLVPAASLKPTRKRSTEPQAFEGLTEKPHCALCERETGETSPAPPQRPDPMPPTNRRPRTVDTSMHFCPHPDCDYRGWLGMHNLRANGHPSGGPWRQLQCLGCHGYFLDALI